MHKILLLLFITIPLHLFSQKVHISGTITDTQHDLFQGVSISLLKDGKTLQNVQSGFKGEYSIDNIEPGIYDLKFKYAIMKEKTVSNLEIKSDMDTLDFFYPEPCAPSKKMCPKGHTDTIIPIVYGFPSKKMMKKAQKGKIKLGGCDNYSFCEKWHCKTHNIDF